MAAHARHLAATASPRERQHVEIMAAVIESKPKLAVTAAEGHLGEYPRDVLVLSMLLGAFGLYAFSGRPDHDAAKLAVCERVAGHYGEDWWFVSYLGWSHTEAGNLSTGRALSERAMGLRAENANAAHVMKTRRLARNASTWATVGEAASLAALPDTSRSITPARADCRQETPSPGPSRLRGPTASAQSHIGSRRDPGNNS